DGAAGGGHGANAGVEVAYPGADPGRRDGDHGGRIREGEGEDGRALRGERRGHRVEVADDTVEVEPTAEDVVDPAEDAGEVRLERERRFELLFADLRDLAPADRQVRVGDAGVVGGEPLGEAVGPAAVAATVGIGVLEP